MWGDGQHPPHLAGAVVDAIAPPVQGAQLQPSPAVPAPRPSRVPQGVRAESSSRDPHGATRTGLISSDNSLGRAEENLFLF